VEKSGLEILISFLGSELARVRVRKARAEERRGKAEEKHVAPPPKRMGVKPREKAQFSCLKELEVELGRLRKEAEEHGEFLERFETARVEGRISEAAREQLRKDRLDRLEC